MIATEIDETAMDTFTEKVKERELNQLLTRKLYRRI